MHLLWCKPTQSWHFWIQVSEKFGNGVREADADKEPLRAHGIRSKSQPERETLPLGPAGGGNSEFTIFIISPVKFGNSALLMIRVRAVNGNVSDGNPRRHAERILAAARSAAMEPPGNAVDIENHENSAPWSPLKRAFLSDPVRIIPGVTVVTWM